MPPLMSPVFTVVIESKYLLIFLREVIRIEKEFALALHSKFAFMYLVYLSSIFLPSFLQYNSYLIIIEAELFSK